MTEIKGLHLYFAKILKRVSSWEQNIKHMNIYDSSLNIRCNNYRKSKCCGRFVFSASGLYNSVCVTSGSVVGLVCCVDWCWWWWYCRCNTSSSPLLYSGIVLIWHGWCFVESVASHSRHDLTADSTSISIARNHTYSRISFLVLTMQRWPLWAMSITRFWRRWHYYFAAF